MFYRLVFFAFFAKAKFSETEVICDIDSIQIKAAYFDYLNGLKIILGDQDQTSGDEGFITNCVADDNRSILLPKESTKRWNFGCGLQLTNNGNEEGVINYQWKGVLKYVRRDSQPIGHIIRKSSRISVHRSGGSMILTVTLMSVTDI